VDTLELVACQTWVEQNFWALKPLVSNQDLSAIWKLIVLLALVRVLSLLKGLVVISNHVSLGLLDVSNDFEIRRCGELESSLLEQFTQVVSQVLTSQEDLLDGMWNGVTFEDWHSMGNTISRVEYNTSATS